VCVCCLLSVVCVSVGVSVVSMSVSASVSAFMCRCICMYVWACSRIVEKIKRYVGHTDVFCCFRHRKPKGRHLQNMVEKKVEEEVVGLVGGVLYCQKLAHLCPLALVYLSLQVNVRHSSVIYMCMRMCLREACICESITLHTCVWMR